MAAGSGVAAAERMHRRAAASAFRGRYDLSRRQAQQALDLLATADRTAEAQRMQIRVLVLLAGIEHEVSGGLHGREQLDSAVSLSQEIGAADLTFVVNQTLALRELRAGRIDAALGHFAAAESIMADAVDLDVCKMLLNRGTLHLQQFELDAAQRDLELCLARAEGNGSLTTLAAMARHNLGYLEFLRGNLPAALRAMDEAAATGAHAAPGVSLLDRARVLIAAGLVAGAERTLQQARAEFRRGRMWADLAETELALAECALLSQDYAAARRLAAAARTRFRRRGNDRWRRQAELSLLAGDLAAGRPPTLLVGPAERLAAEFDEQSLPTFSKAALLIVCEAALAGGRDADAERTLSSLPDPAPTDPAGLRLQQRTVRAELALRRQDLSAARREVARGLTDLARHQAQFGSIDLQTASALHGRRLVGLDVEMALASRRPASVFAALERGRAISHRLVPVTPPRNESAPLLSELRQRTEVLKVIGSDPALGEDARLARERIAALQGQLSSLAWRSAGSGDVGQRATLADVQRTLRGRDKQMVLFGRSGDELFTVVVGRGPARLMSLAQGQAAGAQVSRLRADLNVLAYPSLPLELRRTAAASASRTLSRLDDLLIQALGLSDQPLVIVPTADLSTLPWNSLPSLRRRPVEVAPTATAWWRAAGAPPPTVVTVTAFAGPGLPASEREVQAVSRIWPDARVYVGDRATRRALAESVLDTTVAHVATHGSHVGQNPLFSSLQLTDGPMFAYELDSEHVPPHVVLSACELGQVTVRPGEEALGLTSVLLQLGVQCVIAGVSEVNDELAADVMIDYHGRLAAGEDSSSALTAAIDDHTQSASDGQPDTFVPFVCFGAAWSR